MNLINISADDAWTTFSMMKIKGKLKKEEHFCITKAYPLQFKLLTLVVIRLKYKNFGCTDEQTNSRTIVNLNANLFMCVTVEENTSSTQTATK